MTHLVTLDDWDGDGIPKKIQCHCDLGRDHHACDGPWPEPIQPWTPLTEEDRRKIDDWYAEFIKTLRTKPALPAVFQKPVDWQAEIAKWQEIVDKAPPRRTEPIKLTPGQWAVLSHGDPRAAPPYARPLGDLMGIPVVVVDDESESTPIVEGWLKPKRRESRRERRRRLGLRWWQREAR